MLSRSRRGVHGNTWPGFVDAMTGLLLVLMFVLTIFTVVQFTLRDQISGQQVLLSEQETRLGDLTSEVASLSEALGLSRDRENSLEEALLESETVAESRARLIAALTEERDATAAELGEAQGRITDFEAQVAGLIAQRAQAEERIAGLETESAERLEANEALELALASARGEIDAGEEEARLAAARAEAMDLLIRQLRAEVAAGDTELAAAQTELTEAERRRIADAAAAEALRQRLEGSEAELTAMTLALEAERKQAEETLTLLAAAEAAREDLDIELAAAVLARAQAEREAAQAGERLAEALGAEAEVEALRAEAEAAGAERDELSAQLAAAVLAREEAEAAASESGATDAALRERLARALEQVAAAEAGADEAMSESERQAALLATARAELADEEALSEESQRQVAALNAQVAELRSQVGGLQELLDAADAADAEADVQIEALGQQLNTALARVAAEERRRAELEAAERARAEEEAALALAEVEDLETYRSEFFGRVRAALEGREGVQVVGDRFVFSSDVVFPTGSAELSPEGQEQVAQVGALLREVIAEIPGDVPWIIRVDGHTDDSGEPEFNWQLSQARALSVVRQLSEQEGLAPERLSANGFGEFQPVDSSGTTEAASRNRRIEIKLTER